MLIFICILLGVAAYIAIGCLCCVLFVKFDALDPYDDVGNIIAGVLVWPIMVPLVFAAFGFIKFNEYLQEVYDKRKRD